MFASSSKLASLKSFVVFSATAVTVSTRTARTRSLLWGDLRCPARVARDANLGQTLRHLPYIGFSLQEGIGHPTRKCLDGHTNFFGQMCSLLYFRVAASRRRRRTFCHSDWSVSGGIRPFGQSAKRSGEAGRDPR